MNCRIVLTLVLMSLGLLPLAETQTGKPRSRPPKPPTSQSVQPANKTEAAAPIKDDLKRLILTDGSYQGVMKYQIVADRVRYFSSERYDWEEIPLALIDWEASRKYAADVAAGVSNRSREVDIEAEKERQEEEARSPIVSPGIRLPEAGGVFLLDVYQGRPELNELVQNGADVKKNTAGNILRGAINPIASARQTIELKGPHARVQSHVGDPFIYVAIDYDQDLSNSPEPESAKKRWRIVRLQEKKGNRIVGNVSIAIYGKVKEKAKYIEAEVTPVSGPWLKVVPAQPLVPGEYALVELLGPESMNRFVWDFGVNPAAPANPEAWKPQPAKANITGTEESPVLNQRTP
ncbi:MAG TPA: hypothetical protein VD837_15895 [Terriglobales bacterium]|nr:hypothetical protein [Terriglobales bacterium]